MQHSRDLDQWFRHRMRLSKTESRFSAPLCSGRAWCPCKPKQAVGSPPLVVAQPCQGAGACLEELMGFQALSGSRNHVVQAEQPQCSSQHPAGPAGFICFG